MATLADELLADLMEDGSDADEAADDFLSDAHDDTPISATLSGGVDTDQDQGQHDEPMSEAAMLSAAAAGKSAVTEAEDEDEAKARVAKIHFGGISDVRSVAGLIKSLKPVLEVSLASLSITHGLHLANTALTLVVLRTSTITKRYLPKSRLQMWAP